MPATPLQRAVLAVAFLLTLVAALPAQSVSRLQQVSDELTTLEGVIEKLPENARERKKLEERRQLLERERDILQHRQSLDARESALSRRTQEKPSLRLEAALHSLEGDTAPLQAKHDRLIEATRAAVLKREAANKERQRVAALPAAADRDVRLSALDDQLLTAAEEIESLQLQREATDRRLDLAREAEGIAKRFKDEPSAPEMQLRAWWDRRRELADRLRHQAEIGEINLAVGEKRTAATEAAALAREKLTRIDEEIELLTPKGGLFRGAKGVDNLLAAARRDKESMQARLPFIESQVAALEEAQAATTAHVDLLRQQIDWLAERQAVFTDRLTRWLGWPSAMATFLAIVFLGISRLILPRLYKNEMLVSARRVNRYMMVLALGGTFSLFFFEDLQAMATTLSIVSAAMVIALQDIFISLAGWVALIASRKLRVGDRVEIDGVKGDVLEIELLRTTLLEVDGGLGTDEPSGRVVAIPNNFIFRSRVHNSSHGHRWVWSRSDITVTYETPIADAAAVLQRALAEETAEVFELARQDARKIEHRYGRIDADYRPKFYYLIADSGVQFTMLYICDCRDRIAMRDKLHRRILADFARDTRLQFAYPTSRQFQPMEAPVAPPPNPNLPERVSAGLNGNGKQLTAWPEGGPAVIPTNPSAPNRS